MSLSDHLSDLQARVSDHHAVQFGRVPLILRAAKVAEEAGEVVGAAVRDAERRDRRRWTPELETELGDLFVAMCALASGAGIDLGAAVSRGVDRFERRVWAVKPRPSPPPGFLELLADAAAAADDQRLSRAAGAIRFASEVLRDEF